MTHKLPASIWRLVYSFDATYVDLFRAEVIPELHAKNRFWRIVQTNPPANVPPMTRFELSRSQANVLCDYWNDLCPFNITGFLPTNSFYYAQHVSDLQKIYPILKRNRSQVYSLSLIHI